MVKSIDRLRTEAERAAEAEGLPTKDVQVIVAKTYGAKHLDSIVPPYYTVMVFGVGGKPVSYSAPDADEAIEMAIRRVELMG